VLPPPPLLLMLLLLLLRARDPQRHSHAATATKLLRQCISQPVEVCPELSGCRQLEVTAAVTAAAAAATATKLLCQCINQPVEVCPELSGCRQLEVTRHTHPVPQVCG
jgi:hypothetical protein